MAIALILFLLFTVLPLALLYFYRKDTPGMIRFYIRITNSTKARILYARCLLIFLLLFNLIYNIAFPASLPCYLVTAMIIFLFSAKRAVSLIQEIRNNTYMMAFLFTIGLTSLFISDLLPLGFSLCFIIVASVFTPSGKVKQFDPEHKHYDSYIQLINDFIKDYFT